MESNRLAMGVQGAWERLFLQSANVPFKWDIALMPKGSSTATTVGYASACVATAAGKFHDATWEFIKFMGSAQGNQIYAGLISVPPLKSLAQSSWFLNSGPVDNKIHAQLYEAASIDGAGWWPSFLHVTVPLMTPVIFFELVIGIIGTFQVFTSAFIMTGGGPANATLFYVLYMFQQGFQQFRLGLAAAMAWVLFAIVMALTLLIFRSSAMWVYYEGEVRGRTN